MEHHLWEESITNPWGQKITHPHILTSRHLWSPRAKFWWSPFLAIDGWASLRSSGSLAWPWIWGGLGMFAACAPGWASNVHIQTLYMVYHFGLKLRSEITSKGWSEPLSWAPSCPVWWRKRIPVAVLMPPKTLQPSGARQKWWTLS